MLYRLSDYLDDLAAADVTRTTRRDYRTKLRQFSDWLGDRPLDESALAGWRDHCRERLGWQPSTIRLGFSAIGHYLRWLAAEEPERPLPDIRGVRLPRRQAPQRVVPSDRDVERLLAAARALPAHRPSWARRRAQALAILALLAYAGLRRSELLALEVRDLVPHPSPSVRVRCGKGRQVRTVPLGREAWRLVEAWLRLRALWAAEERIETEALLLADRRRRMSHVTLERLWRDLLLLAGLQESGLTPHGLRHWYATRAAASGGIEVASALLGHSCIVTTQRYLHASAERLRRAAESVPIPTPEPAAPRPMPRPVVPLVASTILRLSDAP